MLCTIRLFWLSTLFTKFIFAQMAWERSISIAAPPSPLPIENSKSQIKQHKKIQLAWNWAIPHLASLRDLSISKPGELERFLLSHDCEWMTRIVIKKAFEPELILLLKKTSNGSIILKYAQFLGQPIHDQAMRQKLANPKIVKPDVRKMRFNSGIMTDSEFGWLREECSRFEKLNITFLDDSKMPLDASVYELSFFSRHHNEFAFRSHDLDNKQDITMWVKEVSARVLEKN